MCFYIYENDKINTLPDSKKNCTFEVDLAIK